MGTNYNLMYNICDHCGRFDEKHVGKKSCGWQFLFHGYDDIKSVKDWSAFISESKGIITNEYGEDVSNEDFWSMVLVSKDERSHYKYIHDKNDYSREYTKLDNESKYTFIYNHFS